MDHLYPITLPSNLKKCNRKLFKSLDGSQISKKLWGGSFFFFQKLIFLVINCSSKSFMTLSTAQILVLDKVINLKYYKHYLYTLGTTIDCTCLVYFDPKMYNLTPKLTICSHFSVDINAWSCSGKNLT